MRKFPDYYWPKRYDWQDHLDWITEKQPMMPKDERISWANKQIELQIGISLGDIQLFRSFIYEAEKLPPEKRDCRIELWKNRISEEQQMIQEMKQAIEAASCVSEGVNCER